LGSQAWEWSHFIHGSGGGFQINQAMIVTATDDAGNTYQDTLDNGTWVHMSSDFGHKYEHAMEAAEEPAVHDEHAGHGEHAAAETHEDISTMVPEEIILNKYTLEHKDGKDLRKLVVKGDDAKRIWAAKEEGSMAFGANMHKNEYAIQQQYANFFFFVTGFHGFHVFLGGLMLAIVLRRMIRGDFTAENHFAFEGAAWYWHFVDVVWLGLYIAVYWM
jgi:hypothetical protein